MLLMDECVIKMFGLVSAVALQFRVGDGLYVQQSNSKMVVLLQRSSRLGVAMRQWILCWVSISGIRFEADFHFSLHWLGGAAPGGTGRETQDGHGCHGSQQGFKNLLKEGAGCPKNPYLMKVLKNYAGITISPLISN